MDHAVELEVTDWAGESDLTVTLSADASLTLVQLSKLSLAVAAPVVDPSSAAV